MSDSDFADRVKKLRHDVGLTQEEFAREISAQGHRVTRASVGNWELGANISRRNLMRIAQRFGVSVDWLSGGVGNSSVAVHTPAIPSGVMEEREGELIELSSLPAAQAASLRAAIDGHKAEVWRLSAGVLDAAGYMPGDLLLVDLVRHPGPGDIVVAIPNGDLTRPLFRLFYPPILVMLTARPGRYKPETVDNETIIIKGVVFGSHRFR